MEEYLESRGPSSQVELGLIINGEPVDFSDAEIRKLSAYARSKRMNLRELILHVIQATAELERTIIEGGKILVERGHDPDGGDKSSGLDANSLTTRFPVVFNPRLWQGEDL